MNISTTIESEFYITNTAFIFDFQLEFSSIAYKVYYHSKNYSALFAFNFCCKWKGLRIEDIPCILGMLSQLPNSLRNTPTPFDPGSFHTPSSDLSTKYLIIISIIFLLISQKVFSFPFFVFLALTCSTLIVGMR